MIRVPNKSPDPDHKIHTPWREVFSFKAGGTKMKHRVCLFCLFVLFACLFVCLFVCFCLVGLGWVGLVSWLVWFIFFFVWSFGLMVGRSVGRLVGWSVGRLVGWLVGWLVSWLPLFLLVCLGWLFVALGKAPRLRRALFAERLFQGRFLPHTLSRDKGLEEWGGECPRLFFLFCCVCFSFLFFRKLKGQGTVSKW